MYFSSDTTDGSAVFERYLLLLEGTYIEFENITLTQVFGILEADHFE